MFTKLNRPTALAIAAVALIIGAVSPWITVFGVISAGPANFTEVGIVVFGGIGILILSALTQRFMRTISILVGALVLLETGHVWFVLSEHQDNEYVTPGLGLYISILAGLFLVGSTWLAKKQA